MIPVTKPYLPDREKLNRYIDGIYDRAWLTNNGPLSKELTRRLEEYLGVENLLLVNNGTLALQIAYRALNISGSGPSVEAITTPFTFIATASSLKWEGVEPVFVDIDWSTWCMDPSLIENAITPRTRAIAPVHVFGNPSEVELIDEIGRDNNLKVVYDASHAFGVKYKSKSVLNYGDASTISFHATKLFHSIEGGAIVFKNKEDMLRASKMINFGLAGPESIEEVGINAKMNEFQAAMGLCVLDEMKENLEGRKAIWELYQKELKEIFRFQCKCDRASDNYAYFPIVLKDETQVLELKSKLESFDIHARRYFYPSLDAVEVLGTRSGRMEVSNTIAGRILCLPIFSDMLPEDARRIVSVIKESMK